MNISEVINAEELLGENFMKSKYDFSNFIKVEKVGERMASKAKLKHLKTIDPTVQTLLRENETVYYIARGLKVSSIEQMFIGHAVYYYNLNAFVFTSERILLIHITSDKSRGTYLGYIEYSDIKKVTSSFLGSFKIKFVNGKSTVFSKMPAKDRKYIRDFMDSVLNKDVPKDKKAYSIRHLCPSCFSHIHGIPHHCHSCDIEFARPSKAAMFSLLMPGLGDIYLGSKVLGVIELIFMIFLWYVVLSPAVDGGSSDWQTSLIAGVILFALLHPIDALKSYYMGKKGLIPVNKIRYDGE